MSLIDAASVWVVQVGGLLSVASATTRQRYKPNTKTLSAAMAILSDLYSPSVAQPLLPRPAAPL